MDTVTIRELRNHGGDVVDRVEAGERVTVTRDGRPVAELSAIDPRPTFVPTDRLVREFRGLLAPDDPLAQELREADTPARDPFE